MIIVTKNVFNYSSTYTSFKVSYYFYINPLPLSFVACYITCTLILFVSYSPISILIFLSSIFLFKPELILPYTLSHSLPHCTWVFSILLWLHYLIKATLSYWKNSSPSLSLSLEYSTKILIIVLSISHLINLIITTQASIVTSLSLEINLQYSLIIFLLSA